MNSFSVIKQTCLEALEEAAEDVPAWRAAYVSVVDPLSVLEMTEIIESLLKELETHHDAGPLVENIRARLGIE